MQDFTAANMSSDSLMISEFTLGQQRRTRTERKEKLPTISELQ